MGGDIVEWSLPGDTANDACDGSGPPRGDGVRVVPLGVTGRAHGTHQTEDLTQVEQMEADAYDDRLKQVGNGVEGSFVYRHGRET